MRTLLCLMRKKATNLTISAEIRHRADHIMTRRGFTSFSAFVEQLIRDAWDAQTAPTAAPDPVAQHLAAILSGARAGALRETAAPGAPPAPVAPVIYPTAHRKAPHKPRRPVK